MSAAVSNPQYAFTEHKGTTLPYTILKRLTVETISQYSDYAMGWTIRNSILDRLKASPLRLAFYIISTNLVGTRDAFSVDKGAR